MKFIKLPNLEFLNYLPEWMIEMKITDQEMIEKCRAICGDAHVETGSDIDPKYQRDWLNKYPSDPFMVVRPDSTEKVAVAMNRSGRKMDTKLIGMC